MPNDFNVGNAVKQLIWTGVSDPVSKLRGLTSEIKAQDEQLRTRFKELEHELKDAAADYCTRGQSENCLLEAYGDDDAYYGHLFFEDELAVAYRTSEDDMELTLRDEPGEPTYSIQNLDKCSPVWLRALATPKLIESLLTSINARIEEALRATAAGVQTLSATANLPLRDLDAGLVEVATRLNFGNVIQLWHEAQSALGVDPPEAATRASRLIETLCKHILHTKGKTLPGDQSIQHLYKAASKALVLGPEQQSSDDLRAIGLGMTALTSGVGALRTHAGTAHGTGPTSQPVTFSQARLAVNAAGVLATFLMDTLLVQESTPPTSAPAP
jgi:hypothetical protein